MKSSVAIALLLLSSQAPTGQQTDEPLGTELHESYKAWFAALDKGDGAALDALEVNDFVFVTPSGSIWEKHHPRAGESLPVAKGARERTWTDGVLRRYGDTAILTGRITFRHSPDRTTSVGTTAVFVRRADKWLMASVQMTPVQEQ
jgi:hypothetical protein